MNCGSGIGCPSVLLYFPAKMITYLNLRNKQVTGKNYLFRNWHSEKRNGNGKKYVIRKDSPKKKGDWLKMLHVLQNRKCNVD